MSIIDFRSDTITQPTNAMRRAMADAEVGDDVFCEDPTVKRLEEMAAERMGKAAALFTVSGTMANLICQMVHCSRGDEMILGDQSHVFFNEQGGSAAVGNIHPRTIANQSDGTLVLVDIEAAIRDDDLHYPRSRLIVLENTHNLCSGSPLDAAYIHAVVELAQQYNLKVHVDGARLFNAATALSTTPDRLLIGVDSVCFCLSKGLAAPVGSMICGSEDFIAKARRMRKLLGGGMRQAGVLAAAGIIALEQMVDRLADDHANAQRLVRQLAELSGLAVNPAQVKTNIIYARIIKDGLSAQDLVRRLKIHGILVLPVDADSIRLVTHYHITPADVDLTAQIIEQVLNGVAS